MKEQTNANHSWNASKKQQQKIDAHRPIGVKRMKIDTASVRCKNRCAKQMIRIYEHCPKHYEISFFPVFPKKDVSQNNGKTKMQKIMDDCF